MGTLTYVMLPDSLVWELLAAGAGIGVGGSIPEVWRGYEFKGLGSPQADLAQNLLSKIQGGGPLPSPAALREWTNLEASALKALDLAAPQRMIAILHADDPVLLESSRGALESAAGIMLKWARRHRATLHTGSGKSVTMVMGSARAVAATETESELHIPSADSQSTVTLKRAYSHRWLRIKWDSELIFKAALMARLGEAATQFSTLTGLPAAKAFPLPLAL